MAANLQIFSDAACTTELDLDAGKYQLQIGPETGLDGTNGETETVQLWCKNTGDILVSAVTLTETLDTPNRGSYSLDDVTYNDSTITLGNMAINDVVTFYTKVTVASGSSAGSNIPLDFNLSATHL